MLCAPQKLSMPSPHVIAEACCLIEALAFLAIRGKTRKKDTVELIDRTNERSRSAASGSAAKWNVSLEAQTF